MRCSTRPYEGHSTWVDSKVLRHSLVFAFGLCAVYESRATRIGPVSHVHVCVQSIRPAYRRYAESAKFNSVDIPGGREDILIVPFPVPSRATVRPKNDNLRIVPAGRNTPDFQTRFYYAPLAAN